MRLIFIGFIIARYRIDDIVFTTPWFYPFRFLRWLNPFFYIDRRRLTRGERIRLACERLGPIFIKFGQALSTRRDILSDDIADELAKLQDQVPPFAAEKAQQIIEKSLQQPVEEFFSHFDAQALASASIAQVHAAQLKDGSEVVVKILRPKVERYIRRDIALLKLAARFMQRALPNGHRIHPLEIIEEFERALKHELDLTREAANATELHHHSQDSEILYVPVVYWENCRRDLLVMERIHGTPIARLAELKQLGVNMQKLAHNLIEMFFKQLFDDNFFHADLHPGNIFVDCSDPNKPKIILVDFGISGALSPNDQRYIAENLLAFFNRDYQQVAQLHAECGWLLESEQVNDFAIAIRAIADPFFEKPLSEISIGYLLLRLFHTAREFEIDIQPQLILLQKNLLYIESLSCQVYPDLDLWQVAKPFLEKWLKRQMGGRAFIKKIYQQLPYWADRLPQMPELIYRLLNEKAQPQRQRQRNDSKCQTRPLLAGAALLIVSALNFALAPQETLSAWLLFGAGLAALFWGGQRQQK
ncbi:MAG: 2-polyprenylphenol 6-hydroxylase [Gammaproteobacteria bacterium]|nr:2-polyprenylphenol 6-hydroxylase [Gammaproteobacteria bacterium]